MIGGHPSALPERTLAEEPVDYVGVGEGHTTLLGLLQGKEIASVPGLVWRSGTKYGAIRRNKPAVLCENMRELHGSVWDWLPMHLYRAHNWQCFGTDAASASLMRRSTHLSAALGAVPSA